MTRIKTYGVLLGIVLFAGVMLAQEQPPTIEPPPSIEEPPPDDQAPVDGGPANSAMSSGGVSTGGAGVPGANSSVPGANDLLNFQADLFTGRFSYSVPIIVAPARQGTEPKLALTYNSAAGNGWCGVGWVLDVGYIERDTKKGVPVKWGTHDPLAEYDDGKGFVFSVAGINGTLVDVGNDEYRNEIDTSFLKFKFNGRYSWEVTDKSGNKFFFGETPESRMNHPDSGWTTNFSKGTFRWALNRVVDPNGNETTVNYSTYNNYQYLTKITYNGNTGGGVSASHTVDFVLESSRNDQPLSFKSNYRVQLKKRLSDITVKVSGQLVRRYHLAYIDSPSTFRSLLQSVTLYGTDDTSSLPPVTFTYQVKPFEFESAVAWTGVKDFNDGDHWASLESSYVYDDGIRRYGLVTLQDIDGDGLPDRVARTGFAPFTTYWAQRNMGSCFSNQWSEWGPLTSQGQSAPEWGASYYDDGNHVTQLRLTDINGDGYPDRVMRNIVDGSSFVVETNKGIQGSASSFCAPGVNWSPIQHETATGYEWSGVSFSDSGATPVELMDMNGDGLPDRVMRKELANFTYLVLQHNTGNGFSGWRRQGTLISHGATDWPPWGGVSASVPGAPYSGEINTLLATLDMNGDGLPDRIFKANELYGNFFIQYNRGVNFENIEDEWGPILAQGSDHVGWYSPYSTYFPVQPPNTQHEGVQCMLIDMNGDGLPDRVMRKRDPPYSEFKVQFNTGAGFTATHYAFGTLENNGYWFSASPRWIERRGSYVMTKADLVDINGDGLVDRVYYDTANQWKVQLNKGPFPDLLCKVNNGIGGKIDVTYAPSTQFNNRDKIQSSSDPWGIGAKALLPFCTYVVDSVAIRDGFGNTNLTTYSYAGGMYDGKRREFRGFSHSLVTDTYGGMMRTFFHQGGGRDWTSIGEYQDSGSVVKKGIPFRIETMGTNGLTNTITLNKVEEAMLHSNGWCFPFISQSMQMEYQGMATYRATAQQFLYDTNNGNVLKISNVGEVTNVNPTNHTFSDDGVDSVYTYIAYASLGDIVDKPSTNKITSDSAGTIKLRETKFAYDPHGNLTSQQEWLTGSTYLTTVSIQYDQFGNPWRITDAAGIFTENAYDSTYQTFVEQKVTASFTNRFRYNPQSGAMLLAIDAKGLVSSNQYDVFFRLTDTWMSTNTAGTGLMWTERYLYNLGGVSANISYNYVRKQVNDAVDSVNGYESYIYADGLGRAIQTRVEAENSQFRVNDTFYDLRGNPLFATLPRFSTGSGFTIITATNLGVYTEYDPYGRPYKVTPAVEGVFDANGELTDIYGTSGDSGSPVAATVVAFSDGSNPWATVENDPEGGVKKYYHDAFGRITSIAESNGGTTYTTTYSYDKIGNLTNVTDHLGNKTAIVYDNLGRKISMTDPDMGTWTYAYDNASRLVQQIDAKSQKIEFVYTEDPLGRLTARKIYSSLSVLVATSTYVYDSNQGETAYYVPKGELFKVIDREGWTKFGYDARGRTTNSTRYVNANSTAYVIEAQYDDADRVQIIKYPTTTDVRLKYSYDNAGNVTNLVSLAGTGPAETFYSAPVFNALGQLTSCKYGSNQQVSFTYYTKSKRLTNKVAIVSTNIQNLSYQYDKVSSLTKITDSVRPSGNYSASISSFSYDGLHRLTNLNSVALGTRNYSYTPIGNITNNGDLGGAAYTYYGNRPHQVATAGGKSYTYDACGNMVGRGTQVLRYDEENQLVQFNGPSPQVTFGYTGDGTRLWRNNNNVELTLWISGIYENRAGRELCDVYVEGQLIATFEPPGQCSDCVFYYNHPDHLGSANILLDRSGNIVQQYEYTAYGTERVHASGTAFPVTHRYTSQHFDDFSGLYYYQSRYYDPEVGRFIQPDSTAPDLDNPQTLNRYAYVLNSPNNFTDPSGYFEEGPIWDVGSPYSLGSANVWKATGYDYVRLNNSLNSSYGADVPIYDNNGYITPVTLGPTWPSVGQNGPFTEYGYFPAAPASPSLAESLLPFFTAPAGFVFDHVYDTAAGLAGVAGDTIGTSLNIVGQAVGNPSLGSWFEGVAQDYYGSMHPAARAGWYDENNPGVRMASFGVMLAWPARAAPELAAGKLTGQMHHGISRPVYKALERHPKLKGAYQARDPRFITQGKNLPAHIGYQTWHRSLDADVAKWVRDHRNATPEEFENYLRLRYSQPDLKDRFPNGL